MTKEEKATYITRLYERSTATQLSDVYGRYSADKAIAFDHCRRLMYENDGRDLKILTHNSYIFTAGFEFVPKDTKTGEVCIMYITPSRNEVIEWTMRE